MLTLQHSCCEILPRGAGRKPQLRHCRGAAKPTAPRSPADSRHRSPVWSASNRKIPFNKNVNNANVDARHQAIMTARSCDKWEATLSFHSKDQSPPDGAATTGDKTGDKKSTQRSSSPETLEAASGPTAHLYALQGTENKNFEHPAAGVQYCLEESGGVSGDMKNR